VVKPGWDGSPRGKLDDCSPAGVSHQFAAAEAASKVGG
jgi:hypothetical protein